MDYIRLGRTGLLASRTAIGAEGLCAGGEAQRIVRKAYNNGINFFDVSRAIPQSEEALGAVLKAENSTQLSLKRNVIIATKTAAQTYKDVVTDAQKSLDALGVEKIDLLQYQADSFLPVKGGEDGIYAALSMLKSSGKVLHIGAVTEDYAIAGNAVRSGLYETLQYPYSMVSSMTTFPVRSLCEKEDVGFLAMRPLCGGVVQNLPLAFGFLRQYSNAVPLWGVRSEAEVDSLLYFYEHPPVINEDFRADVEKERAFFN